MNLNEAQRRAIHRLGQDICVVAGPGSGKTRVLIERFAWLVREKQIQPERILAITFTEKAATNIKKRLIEEFLDDPEKRQAIERAYVSTIHGFCTRLLRENAVAAGVDMAFGVLDDAQSRWLLSRAARRALDELLEERPGELQKILELLHVSTSPFGYQKDLVETLISVYEEVRTAGESVRELMARSPRAEMGLEDVIRAVKKLVALPDEWTTEKRREKREALAEWAERAGRVASSPVSREHFKILAAMPSNRRGLTKTTSAELQEILTKIVPAVRSHLVTKYFAPLHAVLIEALQRLDENYRERKREAAALDFSDLEEYVLRLLRNRQAIRHRIQNQFDHVLMDELQDTNRLQWKILDLIRRPDRFFAVGDINQSIYGFRRADPEVFAEYEKSVAATSQHQVDRLLTNYRSRQEILDTVNGVLKGEEGIEPNVLTAGKEFSAAGEPVTEVAIILGDNGADAAIGEAWWIAKRIQELAREMPDRLDRIAVLCRTRTSLRLIQNVLRQAGVPCLMSGNRALMEAREVRDLVQLLAVIANTGDEVSLTGVLRSPLVGIGDETLLRLKCAGDLWEALSGLGRLDTSAWDEQDVERLRWFVSLAEELRCNRDDLPAETLLTRAIDDSGYLTALDIHARGNVERFLARLRQSHENRPKPLSLLLEEIAWLREVGSEAEAPPGEAANAVQLLTIHGAKGLEFSVVFVAALQKGGGSALPPLCYAPAKGLGVKWRNPAGGNGVGDVVYSDLEEQRKLRALQEENRLLYVAMTRAEERLILTQALHARAKSKGRWATLVRGRFGLVDKVPKECDLSAGLPGGTTRVRVVVTKGERQAASIALPVKQEQEEEAETPPVISGQFDSVIPVTHLSEFAVCPRRYYLGRYLGFDPGRKVLITEEGDDFDPHSDGPPGGAEVGTEVHRLLAGLPVEKPSEEAVRLVAAFNDSDLARRIQAADRVEKEFGFQMEINGVILRGQVDVWFDEGGELVVADYKTDRFDSEEEGSRLVPYRLQLRLYALALERLEGRLPREALLHFLRSGKTMAVSLEEKALAAAREVIGSLAEAQERLEFPPREQEECRRCSFHRNLCPVARRV